MNLRPPSRLLASSYRTLRWLLGAAFVYAAAMKLAHPHDFAEVIADYGIVFDETVFAVAVAIPLAEAAAGIGLALDVRGSLATAAALLVLFTAVLAYGIRLGLEIDCACFGLAGRGVFSGGAGAAIGRDAAMLVVCIALAWMRRRIGIEPRRLAGMFARRSQGIPNDAIES